MNKAKRRICLFCQTWESGGIEAFITNVLTHIDLSRLEIDIVVEQCRESVFTTSLKSLGIHFYTLKGSSHNFLSHLFSFAKLLYSRNYTLIHLHIYQALPLLYLVLAKQAGIPVRIAHSHNTMLRKSKTKSLKMFIHKIARFFFTKYATDWWACSASAARFMFHHSIWKSKKYKLVPNAISLERFQKINVERARMRSQLNLQKNYVIGHIGRLCTQKNQNFLLDVFAQLYQKNASFRLLLVGEGEAYFSLKQKAQRLGIADKVIFYGTSSQIEHLLWAMDLFVFPSLFEGFGIAVIEAQAAGLPVICSDQIPSEAIATNLVQSVSLQLSATQWADIIFANYKRSLPSCSDSIFQLRKAGFEITDLGNWMEKVYMGELKNYRSAYEKER